MKIVLCGGGNATHVLACLAGLHGHDVRILSLYADEAERFRNIIQTNNGELRCKNDLQKDYITTLDPQYIQKDPALVVQNADMVIMAVPSFAHELYAKAIAPYVAPGTIIGGMPAQGGFDLCIAQALGQQLADQCSFFGMETLPWACRIQEFGKCVEVLGTKKQVDICVRALAPHTAGSVVGLLQGIVGELPELVCSSNFLGITLMNINSVWHPTITYGQFRNWDLNTPFDEPPLFYEGADDFTGEKLCLVSDEVLQIKDRLQKMYPGLDLSVVRHVKQWMERSYGKDIGDMTSLRTMLNSNKGYIGLKHQMVPAEGGKGYLPNFKYRYMTEDLPFGLVVTRGIAQLVGIKTPHMDEVITWCQDRMNKKYLVDGELKGDDVASTRSPQRYGFHDLESFMSANHYTPASSKTGSGPNAPEEEVRGIEHSC